MSSAWRLACALCFCAISSFAAERKPHVVLVVWDGMRPDFVNETDTPALWELARAGVWFRNHHSIYPTATNVNAAAIATGCFPNRSGLLANGIYRPDIEPRHPIDSADPETIRRGDEVTHGHYLEVPTFVETLRAAGKQVALAGTKSAPILFDRHNEWIIVNAANKSVPIFVAAPAPAPVREQIAKSLGGFRSEAAATSFDRNRYATRALTEVLWRDSVPDFSLLWLSEPDLAQHDHAPGSPEAIAAIHQSDDNLALVLKALDEKHVRDSTDVLIVSDHGFSTIGKSFDVIAMLKAAGFSADKEFANGLKRGDIMVAGNGGSCLFYVGEHDEPTSARLVEWLQHSDFAGVIFTRGKLEGTFGLDAVHLDHANSPEVVVSFRWRDEKAANGSGGIIAADWNRAAGQGTHATLGRSDVNNLCVASGPHFLMAPPAEMLTFRIHRPVETLTATSNADIAATVFRIFQISFRTGGTDFALPELSGCIGDCVHQLWSRASRQFGDGKWTEELLVTEKVEAAYIDEGNGGYTPSSR